jgi:ParB family transcriptional regulator, chromosome partitioning protein
VSSKKEKPRALGRGLDALLPVPSAAPSGGPTGLTAGADRGLFSCPVERIRPQPGQPRQHFDEAALDELAASLRDRGLLEPIVVRRAPGDADSFEIIAGERRWRAAQRAGLNEVLVVVKDVSPSEAFELALVENVQREDLNPVEFAEALDRLLREHGYTHEELAGVLKKDRSTVTNALRLLKLPPKVRAMAVEGKLSEGHARTLLGLADDKQIEEVAERVVRGKLSVRQTEALVKAVRAEGAKGKDKEPEAPPDKGASVRDVEARLGRHFGTKVELSDRGGKGQVVISYGSLDELDRLLALFGA